MRRATGITIAMSGLAFANMLAAPSPASASYASAGYVSSLVAMSNGAILFNSSGPRDGKPGCQGQGLDARWAIDGSSNAGQTLVSVLLNAYNLKKRIAIVGQDNCSVWGDTETVAYIVVID